MSLNSFDLSQPFPACPASKNLLLPFSIDEMDFSVWLNTLANVDDATKCQKILQVLQTLNNAYPPERNLIKGRTRLFFLEKLGSVLLSATAMLTLFPSLPETSSEIELTANDVERSHIQSGALWSLATLIHC